MSLCDFHFKLYKKVFFEAFNWPFDFDFVMFLIYFCNIETLISCFLLEV